VSAVVLATVLGLSAAVAQGISPAPPSTQAGSPQAGLASGTASLAGQARLLVPTAGAKVAALATVLERQTAALSVPGGPTPSPAASTRAPELPALLETALVSVRTLLVQAQQEPDGGLARLYTSAAQGRLEALRPLLPAARLTRAGLMAGPPASPAASCASGSPSPTDTTPVTTTAEASAPVTGGTGGTAPSSPAAFSASPEAVDATQAVLRAGRHLAYLYQVAEVRLDQDSRADAAGSGAAVQDVIDEARAWVLASCAVPRLPEPGYEVSGAFLKAPEGGLSAVEHELAAASLDLVAVSTGDLRTWAMTQYLAASARAARWSPMAVDGQALPGLPEAAPAVSPTPSPTTR